MIIKKKKEEQVATRERETPHSSPYFFLPKSRVPIVSFSHATTAKIITPVTTAAAASEFRVIFSCLSQHTAIGFGHRKPEVLMEYFCCFFPSRRAVSHKKMKILSPGPPTGRAFQFSKGVPLYPPTYLPAFTVYCVVSVCVCVLVPISLNIQLSMRMCMRRAVGALLQSILVLAIDFSFSFQKMMNLHRKEVVNRNA